MSDLESLPPLELLYEEDGLPTYDIPAPLERLYGGGLGLEAPRLYANFVSSLDGIVAIEGENNSGTLISGKSEADRFLMGLLRACADSILIGAGTMRAAPKSLWSPSFIFPDAAAEFAELRRRLGRADDVRLVVLTASGEIDVHHRALEAGALVLTTERGATALGHQLPTASRVIALGDGSPVTFAEVIDTMRGEGHEVILAEGGPTVIGGLLEEGLLEELFLTLSPIFAGRSSDQGRPGLVEGVELLPSQSISGELLSMRKHGSHLFLRYDIPA